MKLKLWSCACAAMISTQAIAQTAATSATSAIPTEQVLTAANGVSARCMARTTTKHDGHDWTFLVPVPSDNQADFTARGFEPAACGQMLSRLADQKRFVCDLARGNDDVQDQTEAQLGIDARKLCAATKRLLPDTADPSGG
jgi:hypothetical protein